MKKKKKRCIKIEIFSKKQTFLMILPQLMKKITICGDCFVFVYSVTLH